MGENSLVATISPVSSKKAGKYLACNTFVFAYYNWYLSVYPKHKDNKRI